MQSRAPISNGPAGDSGGSGFSGGKKRKADKGKWRRVSIALGGLVVLILIVAVILLLIFPGKGEDGYVNTNRLQAVFLNTGQVYFGNIKTLNSKYFVLTNIYYLETANGSSSSTSSSSSSGNNNVTLVKLGCELHRPYDQMVINSDEVTFWENLQPSGQVAQAVATFQKDNPNGLQCSDQSSSSGSTTNSAQPATTNNSSNGSTSNNP